MSKYSYWISAYKNGNYCLFLLKLIFFLIFSCYEKRLHSPFLPLHRQNKDSESRRHITKLAWVFCWDYSLSCVKEVWVSGLNQHTANVPNRKVPNVRILLLPHFGSLAQLDQSTTLRTSVSGVRVSHESQHWRFGRVGLLHRSWKPADGNVSKVRNRLKRVQKPSLLGLCRVFGDSHRNPLASANLPYRITVVRQILDLQVVVRFHLGQHQ